MARDRQRAKQRRRRQAGAGGAQAGARRARESARDRGLEDGRAAPDEELDVRAEAADEELDVRAEAADEELDVRAEEEAAAPPHDPLSSSPYVEEAQLAEQGLEVPPPGEGEELLEDDDPAATEPFGPDDTEPFDEEDYEPAPDAVEGDLVREERAAESVGGAVAAPRRRRGRVLTFLGHSVDELRRVQWPDRRQTFQGTAVVLGFVVLAGSYLGLMDAIWKPIVEAII